MPIMRDIVSASLEILQNYPSTVVIVPPYGKPQIMTGAYSIAEVQEMGYGLHQPLNEAQAAVMVTRENRRIAALAHAAVGRLRFTAPSYNTDKSTARWEQAVIVGERQDSEKISVEYVIADCNERVSIDVRGYKTVESLELTMAEGELTADSAEWTANLAKRSLERQRQQHLRKAEILRMQAIDNPELDTFISLAHDFSRPSDEMLQNFANLLTWSSLPEPPEQNDYYE